MYSGFNQQGPIKRHKAMRQWERHTGMVVPAFNKGPLVRKVLKRPWLNKHPAVKQYSNWGRNKIEVRRLRHHYGVGMWYHKKTMYHCMMKGIEWPVDRAMQIYESMLQNVCWRMRLGESVHASRRLIMHNGIVVNGVIANCPKMRLRPGDKIAVRRVQGAMRVARRMQQEKDKKIPPHLSFDENLMEGYYRDVCDPQDFGIKVEWWRIAYRACEGRRRHHTYYPGTRWQIRKRYHGGHTRLIPQNLIAARIGRGTHRFGRRRLCIYKKHWGTCKLGAGP